MDYDADNAVRTFNLRIGVRDPLSAGTNSPTDLTITVTDVNDNPPEFTPNPIAVAFDENVVIGYSVTTVQATDPDTGSGGIFR